MRQAIDAMDQANRVDTRAGRTPQEEQVVVLAFAQVQATLAVADAIERQTRILNRGMDAIGVTIAEGAGR
jgi:hypothetical protein